MNIYSVENALVSLENGDQMELNYFLTEEITKTYKYPLYGVQITKNQRAEDEIEQTGPISCSREFVVDLCKKLARNTVTPITLLEIVDDLLSDAEMNDTEMNNDTELRDAE